MMFAERRLVLTRAGEMTGLPTRRGVEKSMPGALVMVMVGTVKLVPWITQEKAAMGTNPDSA
jgi:hypothetical protein